MSENLVSGAQVRVDCIARGRVAVNDPLGLHFGARYSFVGRFVGWSDVEGRPCIDLEDVVSGEFVLEVDGEPQTAVPKMRIPLAVVAEIVVPIPSGATEPTREETE